MAEISLKVDSAYPTDQGYGRVRLDPRSMELLGVAPGDIVHITGERTTAAKVWRSTTTDWNQEKVRIDKYTRANAGVSPGDRVTVSNIETEVPAVFVELTPPPEIPEQFLDGNNFDAAGVINFPISLGDILPIKTHLMGNPVIEFKVTALEPENACIISPKTEFEINDIAEFEGAKRITYEDIGGLKAELARVREMIELPIRHPELFETIGVEPPKGVLLYGPPGTGKTLIAKAVASESGANFYPIAGPEIISKYYGESEQKLREIFEEAEAKAPSVIFIDELDSIAPRREEVTGEVERRVVAQLLTMLDGISSRGQVIVIGATNRPESIDSALRRPGRFDREIEIGVPSEEDRLEILKIHTRNMPLEGSAAFRRLEKPTARAVQKYEESRERLLSHLASISRGFVGADLAALAREAAVIALRRQVDSEKLENEKIPDEVLRELEVTKADFVRALREITPSAMREIALETADVSWTDIGGCVGALEDVRESVEYPLTRKEKFTALGIRPPKGVLLYGPPGTGKTLIAKAVAHESGANFIAVKGPQLLSKWVGESERAVREMFKKARQVAPSVIFFDEIDSLTPARGGGDGERVLENVLNQILAEMDGIEELNDVVVLAASNRPDIIDPALLRSGRFDRLVYIPEPSAEDRRAILQVHTRAMPLAGSVLEELLAGLCGIAESDVEALAKKLAGKSVTVKQVLSAAKKFPRDSEIPAFELRLLVTTAFAKEGVLVKDANREKLLDTLARETEGYVGSDLEGLCREAAMSALRRGADSVSAEDFAKAKSSVHPTMNPRVREYYDGIRQRFKGGLPKEVQNFIEYQ